MVISCGQVPPTITSLKVMIGAPSQLSVAVALPVLEGLVLAVHSIVIFAGHVMMGTWLSLMVIICSQVSLLKQSSIAIQVLMIVYAWAHEPPTVTSLKVMVGVTSQLSVAVASP